MGGSGKSDDLIPSSISALLHDDDDDDSHQRGGKEDGVVVVHVKVTHSKYPFISVFFLVGFPHLVY